MAGSAWTSLIDESAFALRAKRERQAGDEVALEEKLKSELAAADVDCARHAALNAALLAAVVTAIRANNANVEDFFPARTADELNASTRAIFNEGVRQFRSGVGFEKLREA
jgi:hypothetical protein